MVPANQEIFVTDRCGLSFHRLAVAAALVLALGVAGCGRKGSLDLPPAAAAQAGTPADPAPVNGDYGTPTAPKGPNKRIPLDRLLD
jgi:predicted small lipoprotein YifL